MVGTRYGAEDYLEGCFNSLRDEKGLWNDSEFLECEARGAGGVAFCR